MRNRGVEIYLGSTPPPTIPTPLPLPLPSLPPNLPYTIHDVLDTLATAGIPHTTPRILLHMAHVHCTIAAAVATAARAPPGLRALCGWVSLTQQLVARGVPPSMALLVACKQVYLSVLPLSVVGVVQHVLEEEGVLHREEVMKPLNTAPGAKDSTFTTAPAHSIWPVGCSPCLWQPCRWPLALTVDRLTLNAHGAMIQRDMEPLMYMLATQAAVAAGQRGGDGQRGMDMVNMVKLEALTAAAAVCPVHVLPDMVVMATTGQHMVGAGQHMIGAWSTGSTIGLHRHVVAAAAAAATLMLSRSTQSLEQFEACLHALMLTSQRIGDNIQRDTTMSNHAVCFSHVVASVRTLLSDIQTAAGGMLSVDHALTMGGEDTWLVAMLTVDHTTPRLPMDQLLAHTRHTTGTVTGGDGGDGLTGTSARVDTHIADTCTSAMQVVRWQWRVCVLKAWVGVEVQGAEEAMRCGTPSMLQLSYWRSTHPQVCVGVCLLMLVYILCVCYISSFPSQYTHTHHNPLNYGHTPQTPQQRAHQAAFHPLVDTLYPLWHTILTAIPATLPTAHPTVAACALLWLQRLWGASGALPGTPEKGEGMGLVMEHVTFAWLHVRRVLEVLGMANVDGMGCVDGVVAWVHMHTHVLGCIMSIYTPHT